MQATRACAHSAWCSSGALPTQKGSVQLLSLTLKGLVAVAVAVLVLELEPKMKVELGLGLELELELELELVVVLLASAWTGTEMPPKRRPAWGLPGPARSAASTRVGLRSTCTQTLLALTTGPPPGPAPGPAPGQVWTINEHTPSGPEPKQPDAAEGDGQ